MEGRETEPLKVSREVEKRFRERYPQFAAAFDGFLRLGLLVVEDDENT